jgi:arsenate reductase
VGRNLEPFSRTESNARVEVCSAEWAQSIHRSKCCQEPHLHLSGCRCETNRTVARRVSNTFAGIRPVDVPLFIAAQMCGAVAATVLIRWLIPSLPETAEDILLPHESGNQMKTYLFACVYNAGRSQMAAALFNLYTDRSGCLAISAGTEPAERIHPEVVEVMREIGVDLGSTKPQLLTQGLSQTASVLVTMGCGEACPFVPNLRTIDWAVPDPKGQPLQAVRVTRDEIHDRVKELIRSECAQCCKAS